MKTFYVLRPINKLQSMVSTIYVAEKIEDLYSQLAILTLPSDGYITIYKIERDAACLEEVIVIDPAVDQAAIVHILNLKAEIAFQIIDEFPTQRRASRVHLFQQPDDQNLAVLYKLLELQSCTAIPEQQRSYIKKLQRYLSAGFFEKSKSDQWSEIFKLRLNNTFVPLICQYPDLSRALFQNTARAAGEAAQLELSTSTTLARLFQSSASGETILTLSQAGPSNNNSNHMNFNEFNNSLTKK
jgi:hypothetical protein